MKTYMTSEIANIIGIHVNTVRMYEELEFIPKPCRKENGYRIFTERHIDQFKLARKAFKIEVLQNGLRKIMTEVVRVSAKDEFDNALELIEKYLFTVNKEIEQANEAVSIVKTLLSSRVIDDDKMLKRSEVSKTLGITMDTLRNWEMNGLINIKRKENGYRVYTGTDIKRLKIIRSLRCANYSLTAILRMLNQLSKNADADIYKVLNNPESDIDVLTACDILIVSLESAKINACAIKKMIVGMKEKY